MKKGSIPVFWISFDPDVLDRGYWDQGMLEAIFDHSLWKPSRYYEFKHYKGFKKLPESENGAVVVVPARHHAEYVDKINEEINKLNWCLVILTGDEECVFDINKLSHPNMEIWAMSHDVDKEGVFTFPIGFPPQAKIISEFSGDKTNGWFFAGQITHEKRKNMAGILRNLSDGVIEETAGFTQGMHPQQYYKGLSGSKIAPAPPGPVSQDTFRLYEALEAACVPIIEDKEYFSGLLYNSHKELPLPEIGHWGDIASEIENQLNQWPQNSNICFSWWQEYKMWISRKLMVSISDLSGIPSLSLSDITVLIPTSPIVSHPETSIIEETISSVRERLPNSEIFIMIDGVRNEQKHLSDQYNEYVRKLLWMCNHKWYNVMPMLFNDHQHQVAMTRQAMNFVDTETILFVEHDTPLCEEIPLDKMSDIIKANHLDVIRLHHEALILPDHEHMMLDQEPIIIDGIPLLRTSQWSQRPHLARSDFYREIIDQNFSQDAVSMIEDKMHSVAQNVYLEHGLSGWGSCRLAIYAPDGDMKRSYHTDGRGEEPKFEMVF